MVILLLGNAFHSDAPSCWTLSRISHVRFTFLPPLAFLACPTDQVVAVRQLGTTILDATFILLNLLRVLLQVSLSGEYGKCALHR